MLGLPLFQLILKFLILDITNYFEEFTKQLIPFGRSMNTVYYKYIESSQLTLTKSVILDFNDKCFISAK